LRDTTTVVGRADVEPHVTDLKNGGVSAITLLDTCRLDGSDNLLVRYVPAS
jgi:hypothetical protein